MTHASGARLDRPLFLLTVDTEEEWDWTGPFPPAPFSTRNICRVADFQTFCGGLGIRPVYFIDHAVLDVAEHRNLFVDLVARDQCEVGAHLHPWCTPPLTESLSVHNSWSTHLDPELFRSKMINLTERMQSVFADHPFSFRAGRWAMNGMQMRVLAELGYRVDSSVYPFFRDAALDYSKASTRPYFPDFERFLSPSTIQRSLLEIPVTSGFNHAPFERLDRVHQFLSKPLLRPLHLVGILWHLGLMRKTVATPEGQDAADICRCIDMGIRRGDRVFNLFFHSSDLLPGCTPYVSSESDLARFYSTLEQVIGHLRRVHNASFVTMRQAHAQLTQTSVRHAGSSATSTHAA